MRKRRMTITAVMWIAAAVLLLGGEGGMVMETVSISAGIAAMAAGLALLAAPMVIYKGRI